MAITYDYTCNNCGVVVEHDRPLKQNSRHLDGEGVCGTLKRNYKSINLNRENVRAIPRG